MVAVLPPPGNTYRFLQKDSPVLNIALLVAAVLCLVIACIHTFVGSRTDVTPLLESGVPEPAKSTLYFCWHLVTIVLFMMTGLFAWSAFDSSELLPAIAATFMSVMFAFLGFLVALIRKCSPFKDLPQGVMFVVLSAIGILGLWGLPRQIEAEQIGTGQSERRSESIGSPD